MRKIFLALLFMGCGVTGPEVVGLEAGYRVEVMDSLRSVVKFEATAPDTLWWTVVWVDFFWPEGYLWSYGQAIHGVEVPVIYGTGFRFWLDFTVWNHSDTIVVNFMSTGG